MVDESLMWQLQSLSMSKSYRNKLTTILAQEVPFQPQMHIDPQGLIGAILLIEMHQRPGPIRALEWIASFFVPKVLRRSITRGPLQIANGPWKFGEAVAIAIDELTSAVVKADSQYAAIVRAALCWNGAATRQPGSLYGYAEVLCEAYAVAQKTLTHLRRESNDS